MRRLVGQVALLVLAACAARPQPPSSGGSDVAADGPDRKSELEAARADARSGITDAALGELLADHWAWTLETEPLRATRLGIHAFDDRIADRSAAGIEAQRAKRREWLDRAKGLNASSLGPEDTVALRLFVEKLETEIATEVCEFARWNISASSNPVPKWNVLPEKHTVRTPGDGGNLVARYKAIPAAIDAEIALLSEGAAKGWFANAESTRRVLDMVDKQLAQPLEDWPLMDPIEDEHADWHPAERKSFRSDLRAAVVEGIAPALQRYRAFVADIVVPKARPETATGMVALEMGTQCYGALVRKYTTLPRTADEVHAVGLAEIEKINAEMKVLGAKLFKTKRLDRILKKLRTDPALFFGTSEEVETAAGETLAEAKAKMGDFFGVLPKADCVMRRIPDYEAPYTTIAYYRQPNPDGTKPGEYFINVLDPASRPRYEARVLAVHESIPGHHLQIAIAQELPRTPAFIRHGGVTVFVEGWALYTERLAEEMGLYRDDLDRMGMLSFDAWRAGRLVVDTGIHSKGWSRTKAKKFLEQHTALALNNIDNEVDRYIVWPGQALGYKTGQLEIWKLRREAEAALGERFDLKRFHDVVLGGGAVPLSILRERVAAYVGGRAGG